MRSPITRPSLSGALSRVDEITLETNREPGGNNKYNAEQTIEMIRPEHAQIDKVRAAVTSTRIKRRAARDSNIHLRQGLSGSGLRVIRPVTSTFARF